MQGADLHEATVYPNSSNKHCNKQTSEIQNYLDSKLEVSWNQSIPTFFHVLKILCFISGGQESSLSSAREMTLTLHSCKH